VTQLEEILRFAERCSENLELCRDCGSLSKTWCPSRKRLTRPLRHV
jgi:hypothetical protein